MDMTRNSFEYLLLLIMLFPTNWADEILSVCGQPVLSSRIVGGQPSTIGAWPWQVSIRYNGKHFCGGSLVAEQWVLSAAHCFKRNPLGSITVTLGEYQINNPSPNAQTVQIAQVIRNVAFEGTGTKGDIALLRLQRPVKYTPYILPVCLPSYSTEFPEGMSCWVTGWGNIKYEVPLPSPMTLQEVKVSLISVERCNQMFSIDLPPSNGSQPILDTMICAGYEAGGKDACQGDSGGPLVCVKSDSWFLAGIVSWGVECALPYRPGVYTKVGVYADWMKRYVPGLQFGVMPICLQGRENHDVNISASSPLVSYSTFLLLPLLQVVFTRLLTCE